MINTTTKKSQSTALSWEIERINRSPAYRSPESSLSLSHRKLLDSLISIVVNPFSAAAFFDVAESTLSPQDQHSFFFLWNSLRSGSLSLSVSSLKPWSRVLLCFRFRLSSVVEVVQQLLGDASRGSSLLRMLLEACKSLDDLAGCWSCCCCWCCWSYGWWFLSAEREKLLPFHSLLRRQTGRTWFFRSVSSSRVVALRHFVIPSCARELRGCLINKCVITILSPMEKLFRKWQKGGIQVCQESCARVWKGNIFSRRNQVLLGFAHKVCWLKLGGEWKKL